MAPTLPQLLLPHFESHQHTTDDTESSNKRVLTVPARVAQIQQQLQEWALNDAVTSLSLTDDTDDDTDVDNASNGGDDNNARQDILAQQVLYFIDCATATEYGSHSSESIDGIHELAAAVAVSSSSIRSNSRSSGSGSSAVVTTTVLERAVAYSGAILERVRSTACRLTGFLLQYSSASNNNSSSNNNHEELLERAMEILQPRLMDKSQAVRKAAIQASQYFFAFETNTNNAAVLDSMEEALLSSVQHDPSVSNRVAALTSLPVTNDTIPYVIDRVRDVKPKVRVAALQVLRDNVAFAELSADQCAELVRSGLTDRCAATKEAASKMIYLGWIKAVKYNPIDMLRQMDVVLNEDECAKAARVILQAAESDETLAELSDPEIRAFRQGIAAATMQIRTADQALDAETVFFSRVVCSRAVDSSSRLTNGQKDAVTNKVVPDIPVLCEVFERHSVLLMQAIDQDETEAEDSLTSICLQLLMLASMADLEEGSRRHFSAVMKRMLGSIATPDDLVEGCLQALKSIHDKEADFVETVTDVVLVLSSNLDQQDEESAEDGLAENHLVRILSVLTIVLETISPKMASNPSVADFAKYIVPAVTHSNALVREAGVSCFGKMGLFTSEGTLLSDFKPLMLQVASKEEETIEIRAQAMLALSDWSMLFTSVLQPSSVGVTSVSFPHLVQEMMVHSKPAAVCIAAEVASKLLFSGKVPDSNWLARLVMIFFDSRLTEIAVDQDEEGDIDEAVKEVGSPVRLQQILSIFFPAFSVKSKVGQDALMQSILPLLGLVHEKQRQKKKPRGTKAMPILKMVEYICSTVDVGRGVAEDALVGERNQPDAAMDTAETVAPAVLESSTSLMASVQIAIFLSKESENLGTTFLRALCKLLGSADLDLEREIPKDLSQLKQLMEDLDEAISDATCVRALTQLIDVLAPVEVLEEDEDEESESSEEHEGLSEAFEKFDICGEGGVVSPIVDKENAERVSLGAASVEKIRMSMESTSSGTRSSLRSRGAN